MMAKTITIGETAGKPVKIDLTTLLSTRLLLQANSGGGKSWALRRLVEQAFGHIQIIIIDPEGEFSTLREQYGFVLVGQGGETPVDVRTAREVAEKLLELNASAVCDIYELKAASRHQWVRVFLDAMINAPKHLWHPCLVIVDEAHVFCPEKGQGESEAIGAMTDLCTRGRKRGFCAVFATQRLGKLSKNASAELQNRMVGPTFEDIDRKRAADLLGVLRTDEREFFRQIQLLEPGNFFAIGRAISMERILVKVGPVETSHPQAGGKLTAPPPPPESIAKLLPQLADLPKVAEERARTEKELRAEIRRLETELKSARHGAAREATQESIDRAVLAATDPIMRRLSSIRTAAAACTEYEEGAARMLVKLKERIAEMAELAASGAGGVRAHTPYTSHASHTVPAPSPGPAMERSRMPHELASSNGEGISKPQKRILEALAEFEAIGRRAPSRSWLAFLAGSSPVSSGFEKNLSTLRTRGYIEFPGPGLVQLAPSGRELVGSVPPRLTGSELLDRVCQMLSGPQSELLRVLVNRYPESVTRDDLARLANVSPLSSGFEKNVSTLSARDLVSYPEKGSVRAAEWLFL